MEHFDKLTALVDLVVESGFDNTTSFAAMEMFISDGSLREVCSSLLDDNRALDQIAERSFLHASGIYKVVLIKETYSDPEVRIHVWPNGKQFPIGSNYDSVHNHRWNFSSLILAGQFRKSLFQLDDDGGEEYSCHFFRATDPEKLNAREYWGQRFLTRTFSSILRPGAAYGLHNSTLHIIEPTENDFSATLLIRQPYETDGTYVYIPKGSKVADASQRGSTLEPISKKLITSFLDGLARSI